MFPQENEYESLLPKNAHGSPNFDKAACTKGFVHFALGSRKITERVFKVGLEFGI